MIDPQQHEYIKQHLYSSDHDYFFFSNSLGEPFFQRDVLYFYDGETLTLVGFLLDNSLGRMEVFERLQDIALAHVTTRTVHFINYYGPWPLDFGQPLDKDFELRYMSSPDIYNVDLFIDLDDPRVLRTRNARDSIRKAQHNGFVSSIGKQSFLGYEHINLTRKLVSHSQLELSDATYYANALSLIKSEHSVLFEARLAQELVGFAVAHEFFSRKPFLTVVCLDEAIKGVSDFLYATIINHFIAGGARRLGLGYSIHEGLFRYKSKWGGVKSNAPFYQFQWMNRGAAQTLPDCLDWQCQMLVMKSRVPASPPGGRKSDRLRKPGSVRQAISTRTLG